MEHWGTVSSLVLNFPGFDPIAFRVGPLAVHWYALMYLLGFAIGYLLLRQRLHHQPFARITDPAPWTRQNVEDLLLASVAGVILGGRLGYCLFYKPGYYLSHPLEIAKVWEGGMSFHGGVVGVIVALWVYARRSRRPFLEVTDLLVPAAPTGLAAGRMGNFINGELWGRAADPGMPWAMTFPTGGDVPRHPSQLYEFALEGVLLAILLWVYARRERARGQVSAVFVLGYGVLRFIAEFFREPDDFLGLLSGLSMGQWLCIPMILGGAGLWLWARKRDIHAPWPEEGGSVTEVSAEAPVEKPESTAVAPEDADEGSSEKDSRHTDVQ